jgi:hypothetical protein
MFQVRMPKGQIHTTGGDHAKWGIHATRHLVVIGDLNRALT